MLAVVASLVTLLVAAPLAAQTSSAGQTGQPGDAHRPPGSSGPASTWSPSARPCAIGGAGPSPT